MMLSLLSCEEQGSLSSSTKGLLRLFATDAPLNFEHVSAVKVTVDEIKLRNSSGEKITVMSKVTILDLMTLRNGLMETLSEIEIPVGEYDQILLTINYATVEMKDGRSFPLKIPSAASSGLKIFVSPLIKITAGAATNVLLDFDLTRSFKPTMNGQDLSGFQFKPVIRATTLADAGSVSGQVLDVTDESPIGGAVVTVDKEGVGITTAVTDSEGFFKIIGLAPGSYDITAEGSDYGSLKIESVPVVSEREVTTHFILSPIIPIM
jgi:uncharacterized surface anchored protein